MNERIRPNPTEARATGTAVTVLALFAGSALAGCTESTWLAATAPQAPVGALLAALALAAGWLIVARLTAAALGALIGLLPGAVGCVGRAVAARCTPLLVRRLVHAVVGVAVASGPITASASSWADSPAQLGFPVLDRVAVTAPATISKPVSPAPETVHRADLEIVVVQPGDTLWQIAARHLPPDHCSADVARAWPRWYAANRRTIGPNPSIIQPGQRLTVPVAPLITESAK